MKIIDSRRLTGFTLALCYLALMTKAGTKENEDLYVKRFGNYRFNLFKWEVMESWYDEPDEAEEKTLRKFCQEAHKAAGYGEAIVDLVVLEEHTLTFANPNYKFRPVDVLTYGINGSLWYMIEGTRQDCVFYLDLVGPAKMHFTLQKQICDLEVLGMAPTTTVMSLN